MELGVPRLGTKTARETGQTVIWTIAFKVLLSLVLAVFAVGAVDFAYAWNAQHILESAAREAARITVSTPLNSATCRDRTPCSIESAADAAKQYLIKAGLGQASCINPKSPSLSGVLVWVFSCDGNANCSTSSSTVCVKIDMTIVITGQNGAWIPWTKATVQYPHSWALESVLNRLPGRPVLPLPKSLLANALMRD
jgi:TadE-like protein